jgi:hypothetical protein
MSIFIGSNEINDIVIGSTPINSVWIGANQVWSRSKVITNDWYEHNQYLNYGSSKVTKYAGFSSDHTSTDSSGSDTVLDDSSIAPNASFTRSPQVAGQTAGTDIEDLFWYKMVYIETNHLQEVLNVTTTEHVKLRLTKEVTDTGWTSMTIGSMTLNRADADSFNGWEWEWDVTSNPFGSDEESGLDTTTEVTWVA